MKILKFRPTFVVLSIQQIDKILLKNGRMIQAKKKQKVETVCIKIAIIPNFFEIFLQLL